MSEPAAPPPTPPWRPLSAAPRVGKDGKPVAVRLYLPGMTFEPDSAGRARGAVAATECAGIWDARQDSWIDRATGAKVYPSQWQPL